MRPEFSRGGPSDQLTVNIEDVTHRSVSVAVVRTVSAYTGRELEELPPLSRTIDPEALDEVIEPMLDDPAVVNTEVTFDYSGLRITVSSSGAMRFHRPKAET